MTWALGLTSHDIATDTIVTGLSFYLHEDSGPAHAAIYASNGGQPSTLIAETAVSDGFTGWNTFALPPTFLQPGTYYLAVHFNNGAGVGEQYNGSSNSYVNWDGYDPTQPFPANPGNWNSYGGYSFSIYAVGCQFVPTSTETPDPSWTWTPTKSSTPTATDTPSHTPTATATFTPVDCVGSPLSVGSLFVNSSGGGTISIYRRVTLPYNGWAKQLRVAGSTGTNCSVQGALYSDNGSGTAPVSQLSSPVAGTLTGPTTLTLDIPDTYLYAGTYWLGFAVNGSNFPRDTTGGPLAVHTGTAFPTVVTGVSGSFYNIPSVMDFCTTDLTPTQTETPTPTITLTFTRTFTPTITPTETSTRTLTSTSTSTRTFSPTFTLTESPTTTETPTLTLTSTSTETLTVTDTPTETSTATLTFTLTSSPTITLTPTVTLTPCPAPLFFGTGTFNPATGENATLDTMIGQSFQVTTSGNAIRLRVNIAFGPPFRDIKMALFNNTGGLPGVPGTLLSMSNWTSVTTTGWTEVEITDAPVTAGNFYWILFLQTGGPPNSGGNFMQYATAFSPIQKLWYNETDIPTVVPPAEANINNRNYMLQVEVCP